MAGQQARVDRIERSLKRLGFRLRKVGRSFHITDGIGEFAINSKPAMSLAEIESWIGEFIRPGGKPR
jgi:hypothetical protein